MSHEIRTPMNAIMGLTYLMSRDTRDALARDRLDKIEQAARHLLHVINDILDLSKIEADKMTLEDIPFSLDDLLSRVVEIVRPPAQEKGLELIVDTDHLPSRMRGDPTRLAQSLINLLGNAVKFTAQGWVRLRGELLGRQDDRLHVRFEVQDTGEGIAADRQAHLFEAFEQADSSLTRRHGGTGLGLALTKRFAALMGGEVGMRSELGRGSTFWFTAWLGDVPEAGEVAPPPALTGLRALLVDDLAEARAALGERLTAMGFEVDALPSGVAALEQVRNGPSHARPYDVFVVDWRMAPLDGIETLRQLAQRLGAAMPPSILVSAHDDPEMRQAAHRAGCEAVLIKPVTPSALHDALVRVLRLQAVRQRASLPDPGDAQSRLARHHAGQRVLLVDDHAINQEVACELLSKAGLVVEVASDGAEALERVLSRPYDLVLMDVQMPVMDGLTAARHIRSRLGGRLPIVAMTASAFAEDRQSCLEAGMNDHVSKPVDPRALYATLLRWLPARTPDDGSDAVGARPLADGGAVQEERMRRLSRIDGFDLSVALGNTDGNVALLMRLLTVFIAQYQRGAPALKDADGPDTLSRWIETCHAVRGAIATIGGTVLAERLKAFEAELHRASEAGPHEATARHLHASLVAFVARLAEAVV